MTDSKSPYDELLYSVQTIHNRINRLSFVMEEYSKELDCLKERIKSYGEFVEEQKHANVQINKKIEIINKRLKPENPGDINTLYQNWDKD